MSKDKEPNVSLDDIKKAAKRAVRSGIFQETQLYGKENRFLVSDKYKAGGVLRDRWVQNTGARTKHMKDSRGYVKPSETGIEGLEDQTRGDCTLMVTSEESALKYEAYCQELANKKRADTRTKKDHSGRSVSRHRYTPSRTYAD